MNMETGGFGGDDRRRFLVPALIVAAALVVLLLILGISAVIRSRSGGSPTATVTRTATRVIVGSATAPRTPVPSTGGSAAPSARPSVAPSAAPSAAPAAKVFLIANTGGDNVNLRKDASAGSEVLARLAEGDEVTEIGPVANADGREWRHIRTKDGIEGWVASEFTAPK